MREVEKRNRPPKSCDPCRLRKLKCDRALPCDTCIRRGKPCQYAANADRTPAGTRDTNKPNVGERLKHLEDLVMSMAQQGTRSDTASTAERVSRARGRPSTVELSMRITNDHGPLPLGLTPAEDNIASSSAVNTNTVPSSTVKEASSGVDTNFYVDSSHWSCLLEDIREIRDQLAPPTPSAPEPWEFRESLTNASTDPGPRESLARADLVFERSGTLELPHILRSLPPRQMCDRLVSQYFRARHAILPIVHPVKFQREYSSFWEAPDTAPPLWVGLIFAILSLGAGMFELSATKQGSEQTNPSAKSLSHCTEQCLVLGQYATAKEYSLEVLLVHLQSCYLRSKDADFNLWFLMGIIIRLALKLGYHRDPSKLATSRLSPFDGEMRRRVWITIFQIDTLMSFQMGLPSMIPAEYCDTELPRNLENSDFGPETTVLPEPRPTTDLTPILYTIAKNAVMTLFRAVISHTRALTPPPYGTTMSLDAQVRSAYDGLPSAFKYIPISQSIVDSPGMIMDRTTIEILHLKSIIVLHRQFIANDRHVPDYDISRRACLEAAETVLARQVELHEATQPGCQLYDQRWMVSALTTSDFILAAMIICLELTIRTQRLVGTGVVPVTEQAELSRYLNMLRQCHSIWAAAVEFSAEARMAYDAIGSTIRRIEAHVEAAHSRPMGSEPPQPVSGQDPMGIPEVSMSYDETAFVDWGILDNQFPESWDDGIDLDSWILDTVGPSSRSVDLS